MNRPAIILLAASLTLWLVRSALPGSMGGAPLPLAGASGLSNGSIAVPSLTLTPASSDQATPTAGCLSYNSTRKAVRINTAAGFLSALMVTDPTVVDSTTLANPTAATTFSQTVSLLGGTLVAGRAVRLTAFGKYTTGAGATPTIDIGWNYAGTPIVSSGLVSTAINLTDKAWRSECVVVCRTVGATGTVFAVTRTELGGLLAALLPTTQVNRSGSNTVNTTVDALVGPTAKFGVSDASNAITVEGVFAEILN